MAKTDFASVDAYLASQPPASQKVLARVRSIIRKAVPAAEERISYQIPTFSLEGTAVLFFAGWKEHFSLYPASDRVVTELASELAPYAVAKGTIRFPFTAPFPAKLIERIAKLRAKEVAERVKAKPKPKAAAKKVAKPKTKPKRSVRTS